MVPMPLFKDERELIRKSISPKLKKSLYNVRLGVRLKRLHSKLKKEDVLSTVELDISHPFSPDIDVLYWRKDYSGEPILNAVEVKYFKFDKSRLIRPPFYDGIGEALTLCTYGVDYVHLWHFFDPEIPNETYNHYKNILETMMGKIRTINYKCELLTQPTTDKDDKLDWLTALGEIVKVFMELEYKKNLIRNELRYNDKAYVIRTLIKRAYRIVNK